jgi:hypothetical protein
MNRRGPIKRPSIRSLGETLHLPRPVPRRSLRVDCPRPLSNLPLATSHDCTLLGGRKLGQYRRRRYRNVTMINCVHQLGRAMVQHVTRALHRSTTDVQHVGCFRL